MNKDTVIGIGVGVLIGWLLWRRRGLAMAFFGGGSGAGAGAGAGGGGCCGGCSEIGGTGGTGNYAQGQGVVTQGWPQS